MRIVCDNPHHDAGEGVCTFCVIHRTEKAVLEERERCIAIVRQVQGSYLSKDINPDWMAEAIVNQIERRGP